MLRRLLAIAFIYGCASVAWLVLGATIFARTKRSDAALRGRVASTWGAPQEQAAPTATIQRVVRRQLTTDENGKAVLRTVEELDTVALPLERTRARADIALEHRRKGLMWYSTYRVTFAGTYAFRNTTNGESVTLALKLPTAQAVYDDLTFTVDGVPVPTTSDRGVVSATLPIAPGETATLAVGYRSQGLGEWRYDFGDGEPRSVARVRDFQLTAVTNFRDVDFAENSLSPSQKRETRDGWELTWRYGNLVSGYEIAVVMPDKLQPGPLAAEISLFAPVSLFFFFFLMFIITTVRGIELHPMNYFFLAAAFFSFHVLLAYLADHVSIHAAFVTASAVSVFLVVTYLRLAVGVTFAFREAALAQVLFLVLFSYAFFFEGFTGLAITIGSILTLFVTMQMTGRIRWAEAFGPTRALPRERMAPAAR
ncbi:MAG: inner membrane CreD family protein [Gemmatimonadota bacterium]|nr:inner membrane CreD family protein [Gemmatimonadota bacterium]